MFNLSNSFSYIYLFLPNVIICQISPKTLNKNPVGFCLNSNYMYSNVCYLWHGSCTFFFCCSYRLKTFLSNKNLGLPFFDDLAIFLILESSRNSDVNGKPII